MIKITNSNINNPRFLLFTIFITVLFLGFGRAGYAEDQETNTGITKSGKVINPGTDLWRNVRQRNGPVEGSSQVLRDDAGTMIDTKGEDWRLLRVNKIIPYSTYLLGFALLAIFLFRIIKGKMKISAGRSGKQILRFTFSQRFIHWGTAILFVILAITGIVLLLGRTLLLPFIGSNAFSSIASVGKTIHDYCGPVFAIFLVLMLFKFIKGNFYKLSDLQWFAKGGGLFGTHASSGRYNAGEKTWFWLVIIAGAVIVGTGLVLDFPIFDQGKDSLRQMQVIHVIAAVILIAASLGHIYMGTIAMEGAYETMKTGYCDSNWAKEHHDEWYEEVKDLEETHSSSSS